MGWPLPRDLPSLLAIRDELACGWSPGDQVVVKALAIVCWAAWAEITGCTAVKAVGVLRGCSVPKVPMAELCSPWWPGSWPRP